MQSYLTGTTPSSNTLHSTILLAEDDPDDQEMITEAFLEVDPNFKLHIVTDGKQVLEYLGNTPDAKLPCLIVLDYNMPLLNGIQVLCELNTQSRYANIPKVILSTSGNPKYIKEAEAQGAYAYKVKPQDFTHLVQVAKEMMQLCGRAA